MNGVYLPPNVNTLWQDDFLLIDFNPYCPATDPLLFSWEELAAGADTLLPQPSLLTRNDGDATQDAATANDSGVGDIVRGHREGLLPVFRVVDGDVSMQPSDLHRFRLPKVNRQ